MSSEEQTVLTKPSREASVAAIEVSMDEHLPIYHEWVNAANAVTRSLKCRKNGPVPGSRQNVTRWDLAYSNTRGFTTQTAFFVPFYREESDADPVVHCMVLVDRVMLLYTPPEDVANYIYEAVNNGRCWIPRY